MDCFINGQIEECIELSFKTISLAKEYKDGTCLIGIFNWVTEALKINGRVKFALDLADDNLRWLQNHSMDSLPNICLFYGAYLNLCIETNQLGKAWEMLGLIESGIHQNTDYRDIAWSRYFLHCDLLQTCGQADKAITVLDSLEVYLSAHFDRVNLTLFPKVPLVRALLNFQQGDSRPLLKWAETPPNPDVNNCPIQYDFEQGAYSLAVILQGKDASAILADLRAKSIENGMLSTRIETYLVEAIGFLMAGKAELAIKAFSVALELGSPCGYVNLFIGKGPVVEALLKFALPLKIEEQYCQYLLDEIKNRADFLAERLKLTTTQQESESLEVSDIEVQAESTRLVESLTPREKEVLEYIRQGYSNKKAADALQLSPTTIRTHLQNIYGKLGVHTRTEAVALVNDLGLLA
jgi:ATP/maltotriose-dependent transcriptional regulator MalT